jgi:hypothetical protein
MRAPDALDGTRADADDFRAIMAEVQWVDEDMALS